jgi:hypothetical protein
LSFVNSAWCSSVQMWRVFVLLVKADVLTYRNCLLGYQTSWCVCVCNAIDIYSGDYWFESWLDHQLASVRFLVVFLSTLPGRLLFITSVTPHPPDPESLIIQDSSRWTLLAFCVARVEPGICNSVIKQMPKKPFCLIKYCAKYTYGGSGDTTPCILCICTSRNNNKTKMHGQYSQSISKLFCR